MYLLLIYTYTDTVFTTIEHLHTYINISNTKTQTHAHTIVHTCIITHIIITYIYVYNHIQSPVLRAVWDPRERYRRIAIWNYSATITHIVSVVCCVEYKNHCERHHYVICWNCTTTKRQNVYIHDSFWIVLVCGNSSLIFNDKIQIFGDPAHRLLT